MDFQGEVDEFNKVVPELIGKASKSKKDPFAEIKSSLKDSNVVKPKVFEAVVEHNKQTSKKKPEDSVEYIFVFSNDCDGKPLLPQFRKQRGSLYRWNGEYWKPQDREHDIAPLVLDFLQHHKSSYSAKKVQSIIDTFALQVTPLPEAVTDDVIIPTKQHWLKVDPATGDIQAVAPNQSYPITYQVNMQVATPGTYMPVVTDGMFKTFIKSSLPDQSTEDLTAEYCGYSLSNSVKAQAYQIWLGNGGNGKSVLLNLLKDAHSNPVSTDLSTIDKNGNICLADASFIFCPDQDFKKPYSEGFLKAAVAGDEVQLKAMHKDYVQKSLNAKWLINANGLPVLTDFSEGLARRMTIVNWTTKPVNPIQNLEATIKETDYKNFLDWCLLGLQRLIRNGSNGNWKFTDSMASNDSKKRYLLESDQVRTFLQEFDYVYDKDLPLADCPNKQKVFDKYSEWAIDGNYHPLNIVNFWNRVRNITGMPVQDFRYNNVRVVKLKKQITQQENTNV